MLRNVGIADANVREMKIVRGQTQRKIFNTVTHIFVPVWFSCVFEIFAINLQLTKCRRRRSRRSLQVRNARPINEWIKLRCHSFLRYILNFNAYRARVSNKQLTLSTVIQFFFHTYHISFKLRVHCIFN